MNTGHRLITAAARAPPAPFKASSYCPEEGWAYLTLLYSFLLRDLEHRQRQRP